MSAARRVSGSIGAVLAGLVTVFVLSMGTDALLHASGVFPPFGQRMPDSLFLLATAYRIVWYALAVAAQAIPCAWSGGALRQMQLRSRALGEVA